MYEYRLFGLAMRSALALPELETTPHDDPLAVTIATARVADLRQVDDPRIALAATPGGAVLDIADIARFAIEDGRRILIDPYPGACERDVRLFLLGTAMAVLLHQRGILPLHANAIEIGGGAVAFMGHSGAGKSTLAAAFHDRGHRILSDDVCAVERSGAGYIAQPGFPRLRLWRDAVERSGRIVEDYERAFGGLDKYTVGTSIEARSAALPLRAIFLLTTHDDHSGIEISPLAGTAAIAPLVANTYRGRFIRKAGSPHAHFTSCVALGQEIPVFQLSRPWDPTRIDETMERIETHLRDIG